MTSCPPTDASAAGLPRCAAHSSRHSSGPARCCSARRIGRLPSRTWSGVFAHASRSSSGRRTAMRCSSGTAAPRHSGVPRHSASSRRAARTWCSASSAASSPLPRRRRGCRRPTSARWQRARAPPRSPWRAWMSTPGPTTRPPPASRRRSAGWTAMPGRSRSSTRPVPPAGSTSRSTRLTSITSHRRRTSAQTADCGSPSSRPRPSSASSGSPLRAATSPSS